MLGAAGKVEVGHISAVHAFLDREVEHGLLLAVVDARNARLVRLLVVELQVLDDADGDVLERRLHIAEHELLAVEQNLLHLLAVDGDFAVLVDIGTGNAFDELLDGRTFRGAVGLGIVDDGILAYDDLRGTASDDGLLEQDALRLHQQVAEVLVLVAPQRYLALNGLVPQRRDAQTVGARSRCQHVEVAAFVGHRSSYEGTVGSGEQLDGSLYHRLL